MLRVPLKTTVSLDLLVPLKSYIKDNFSKTDAADLQPAMTDIQRARELVGRAMSSPKAIGGEIERAIIELEEYLAVLCGLRDRFPFGIHDTGNIFHRKKASTVMIQFQWTDAFRPKSLVYSNALEFELSSVTFNIGALYSRIASQQDRSTSDGASSAAKYYQKSAGVFEFVSANFAMNCDTSEAGSDLSAGSLNMLHLLMIAQAASCSFENAIMKKSKCAVLAVLAQGCSDAYEKCRDVIKANELLSKSLSKGGLEYLKHCTYNKRCLDGAAQFWQSHKDEEEGKHGELISRLMHAKSVVESSVKYELHNGLQEGRLQLVQTIDARLQSAIKDNDSIYHYPIPDIRELTAIASRIITKPVPYKIPSSKLPEAFDKLVPLHVHKAIETFRHEMSDEIAKLSKICADSSDIAKAALAEMNLPAALDALESDVSLPDELWANICEAQQSGGLASLDSFAMRILDSSKQSWALLKTVEDLLKKEQRQEHQLKSQFQSRWTRMPSQQITSSYNNDLSTIHEYLNQAQKGDSRVNHLIKKHRQALSLLSLSREQLNDMLPKLDSSCRTESSENVRCALRKLSKLLNNRDKLMHEFIEAIDQHDTTRVVMSQKHSSDKQEILKREKKSFDNHRDAIDINLARQSEIFDNIVEANTLFVDSNKKSSQLAERTKVLQQIHTSVESYAKIERSAQEGYKFYTDLLTKTLTPLEDNVRGFVAARDCEARLLLEELTHQFGNSVSIASDDQQSGADANEHMQESPSNNSCYPSFGPSAPDL